MKSHHSKMEVSAVNTDKYSSFVSLNRRLDVSQEDLVHHYPATLKTLNPLRQSIVAAQQSRRISVALKTEYYDSSRHGSTITGRHDDDTIPESQAKVGCFKRFTRAVSRRCQCCHFFLTKYHPKPEHDASCCAKLCYALRFPPHSFVGSLLTGAIAFGFVYMLLLLIFTKAALPTKCVAINETIMPYGTQSSFDEYNSSNITAANETFVNGTRKRFERQPEYYCKGSLFAVFIVLTCALIAGTILHYLHLPPMLGMIVTGVLIRNIPGIEEAAAINKVYFSAVRNIGLAIILTRAGLCMDLDTLKRLSAAVFRLAFVPCVTEAAAVTLGAYLILGFPPEWGFMLGFVLGAVSPAIVVLSMLKLEKQGYGVNKGIPTLVIAAASMDDVLAITGFSFCTGFAFAVKNDILKKLIMGPTEALCGLLYGLILGWILWYLPSRKSEKLIVYRTLFIVGGGIVAIMGSSALHFEAAGAIGCLTLSFMAGYGWKKRDHWTEENSPIIPVVDGLWWIAQPLLFGLIGVGVNFRTIRMDKLGMGLGVVAIGLIFRMLASFVVVTRIGLNMREKLFVPFAWLPKATVQAAIGPIALDFAMKQNIINEQHVDFGQQILAIAAIVILITAPLGALSIAFLGPRLLTKDKVEEIDYDEDEDEMQDKVDTDNPMKIINNRAKAPHDDRKLSWQDQPARPRNQSMASQSDGLVIGEEDERPNDNVTLIVDKPHVLEPVPFSD